MTEITKNSKDESSEIEIFWNVIFTFFNGFINISNCFIEIVSVEMKNGSEIEEGGDMIVAELRKMSDSNGDILDSFLKILIFL